MTSIMRKATKSQLLMILYKSPKYLSAKVTPGFAFKYLHAGLRFVCFFGGHHLQIFFFKV